MFALDDTDTHLFQFFFLFKCMFFFGNKPIIERDKKSYLGRTLQNEALFDLESRLLIVSTI